MGMEPDCPGANPGSPTHIRPIPPPVKWGHSSVSGDLLKDQGTSRCNEPSSCSSKAQDVVIVKSKVCRSPWERVPGLGQGGSGEGSEERSRFQQVGRTFHLEGTACTET